MKETHSYRETDHMKGYLEIVVSACCSYADVGANDTCKIVINQKPNYLEENQDIKSFEINIKPTGARNLISALKEVVDAIRKDS